MQRYAFADLDAMKNALDEQLYRHGLKRTDYEALKDELEDCIDLRQRVLVEYEGYCGEDWPLCVVDR